MYKLLSCFLLQAVMPLVFAQANLVRNGNFEEMAGYGFPSHWSRYKDVSVIQNECGADRNAGVKSAYRLKNSGETVVQMFRVEGGKKYQAKYRLKTDFPNWKTTASFQILWYGKDKKPLFNEKKAWVMNIKNIQGKRDWQTHEMECTAPENAFYGEIRLLLVFDKQGTCWFTDIQVHEMPRGDQFANRIMSIPYYPADVPENQIFDPSIWKHSTRFSDFLIPAANTRAHNQTEAEAFYTDNAIYLNIRCYTSDADRFSNNENIHYALQEGCEIFLLPPEAKHQYQILLTAGKQLYCFTERWGDGWPMKLYPWKNNGIVYEIKYQKNFWQIGMKIPFSGFGVKSPEDGMKWRMNICRSNHLGKTTELSAWSALHEPHFQFTDDFGQIIFTKDRPIVKNIRIMPQSASFTVSNPGNAKIILESAYVEHNRQGAWSSGKQQYELNAGEMRSFTVPAGQIPKGNNLRYLEIRQNGKLLAKHSARLSDKYYALGIFDPEGVRGDLINVAVDHPFFMSFNFRHNDPDGRNLTNQIPRSKKAFDLFLETPAEFHYTGMIFDVPDWEPVLVKPVMSHIEKNGVKKNLYQFKLPMITSYPEPYYVFTYNCTLPPEKEFSIYYYLTMNGRKLDGSELNLKTLKMGSVKHIPRLFAHDMFYMNAKTIKTLFPKDTITHYTALGMNRFSLKVARMNHPDFYAGDKPVTTEDFSDLLIGDIRKSGKRIFLTANSNSATPKAWYFTMKDKDARALNADGKDAPYDLTNHHSLCPTYRGKYFQEHISNTVNSYLFRKYRCTWLTLDIELWAKETWEQLCFCSRCLNAFKKYAAKHAPEFKDFDVRKEFKARRNKKFLTLWDQFKAHLQSQFFHDLTAPVKEIVKTAPFTSPLRKFTVGEWRRPGKHLLDLIDYFELGLYYTPDIAYQKLEEIYQKWGDERKNLYATFTFGQTFQCPDFHMAPDQLTELIYEAAIYGMQGICWYYYNYAEPLRMKYIVEGFNTIVPFEDLIINGHIVNTVKNGNPATQVTRREYNGEGLIAIRAYGAPSAQKTTLAFTDLKKETWIYHCKTGKKIAELSPAKPSVQITIPGNRCDLFYIGSPSQWKERMKNR